MAPELQGIDHIHVFVTDRARSEAWYANVMGLRRMPEFETWAAEAGPLTLANASGTVHLALFERRVSRCLSTVALRATAAGLLAWRSHLERVLDRPVALVDHQLAWSMYFSDPDGNPYEVTTYDYDAASAALRGA